MTSLLRGLLYGVAVLSFASAIEFRGYKLYDPTNVTNDRVRTLDAEDSADEYQIKLPADTGKPRAFKIEGPVESKHVRIVRNHTKGTAHGVHLVFATGSEQKVYDVPDGKAKGSPIKCNERDVSAGTGQIRCVTLATGWMSEQPPTELYVFQHVVHSRLIVFPVRINLYMFYILREDDKTPLQINVINKEAKINILYNENVQFDDENSVTLSSLSSNATVYEKNFVLIGMMTIVERNEDDNRKDDGARKVSMTFFNEFFLVKRSKNADVTKCGTDDVTLGTTRITFRELTEPIIFVRNMDDMWQKYNMECFDITSRKPTSIKTLNRNTLETPDRKEKNEQIVIYEARASLSQPLYAVSLSYKPDLDDVKHGHHVAMVNNATFHLDDLRYAREVLYTLEGNTHVVRLFRSTPAIKLTVLEYDYAFKVFPYWTDQCMPQKEHEPLHNYYEAISHGGPAFVANDFWADPIITNDQCVNRSLLNVSLVGLVKLAEHHLEEREINGTTKQVERDMSQTYEEYKDIHVDQRNRCNDINVLSQIKRTIRKVSKDEEIALKATDEEPTRVTLDLEEGERFLLRFLGVEREESKCQGLDTVAIFLKDGMLVNEKAYIRTMTYKALATRNKTWIGTGKLTIAIPNACFRVEIVSMFSLQRANILRNLRKCIIVFGLTILMSGTFIVLYYKFSLAGTEYRRLRRMYKRAKRHDNFVRHYIKWKENVEEIIANWEKGADDN